MYVRVENQQEIWIHRAVKIRHRMQQFSKLRATIDTVQKVVTFVRLVRKASVIINKLWIRF